MTELYAALDLGSNSFHMLLARRRAGQLHPLERAKEKVQLLAGFRDGRLSDAAIERGLSCLARFAQRLITVPRSQLRMVGTHALREAANRDDFVTAAERIMGSRLDIVSGEQEARLIYAGVAHHAPFQGDGARLVIDIGGGSTEFAWGSGAEPEALLSCKLGCVSLTDAHFRTPAAQDIAYRAARAQALEALRAIAGRGSPADVVGTSGTVESVQQVLAANGWGAECITPQGLRAVVDAITQGRWLVEAGLPGLAPERVDIFPAGVAILDALFEVLKIADVRYVDASLQQGLLYEELGAAKPPLELRERTVALLQDRYAVDRDQARRVKRTALGLFDQLPAWWDTPAGRWRDLLGWAADLHEMGLAVGDLHYHRHGAYLVRHSEMRGFSDLEQTHLALLVRGHRRSFPGLAFGGLDIQVGERLTRLLALLRLAVILERSHSGAHSPAVKVSAVDDRLILELPEGWLQQHPMSSKELDVEAAQLASAGIHLLF